MAASATTSGRAPPSLTTQGARARLEAIRFGAAGAGKNELGGPALIGERANHRIDEHVQPLPRIEAAEVEPVGSAAEAITPGASAVRTGGAKPSGYGAWDDLC